MQERLQKNKQSPARSKAIANYLLTGKVICGECQSNYIGDSSLKSEKRYNYYSCSGRKNKQTCDSKPIVKEKLEYFIVQKTMEKVLHDDIINQIADTIIDQQKGDTNPALELLESDLKEANKSLSNLMKALEQGIFTNTTKQRMEELEEEKETLELRITQEKIIKKHSLTKEQIIYFLNQFKKSDANV